MRHDQKKTEAGQPDLSVVVPFYNEVENVERVWQAIYNVVSKMDLAYEIILVDDGSDDGTRELINTLSTRHPFTKGILFRSNFGQSAAMAAGFKETRGKMVIAMDGDLQNDPRDIPALIEKLKQGNDVVSGWRKNRRDKYLLRKFPSKIANRLICSLTDVELHDTGCSLKAFRGDLLRSISLYGEMHRFIPALTRMQGAKIVEMPVRHHARKYGESKYNLSRTFRVIMDLTTLRLLMYHLNNPLSFFAKFSALFFFAGTIAFIQLLSQVMKNQLAIDPINISATLVIILWASSIQFLLLGLVGYLIVGSGSRKDFIAKKLD